MYYGAALSLIKRLTTCQCLLFNNGTVRLLIRVYNVVVCNVRKTLTSFSIPYYVAYKHLLYEVLDYPAYISNKVDPSNLYWLTRKSQNGKRCSLARKRVIGIIALCTCALLLTAATIFIITV
uniref:Uncharacterized protein n=1 Tax=Glossina pallidipes TaxID=7398 RepID=A0A1B0AHF3_GLOPL